MKTAKFTRNGESPKFIPGFNYKGFLTSSVQIGVGEAINKGGFTADGDGETWEEYKSYKEKYRPYFDNNSMDASTRDFVKYNIADKDLRDVIGTEYEKYLIIFGTTANYTVVDVEEEKANKAAEEANSVANKSIPIKVIDGSFGKKIVTRLPAELFAKIKHEAKYWSAADIDDWNEDMDDFSKVGDGKYDKGWYYTENAVEILKNLGYEII
jgi:hypothetical protein